MEIEKFKVTFIAMERRMKRRHESPYGYDEGYVIC